MTSLLQDQLNIFMKKGKHMYVAAKRTNKELLPDNQASLGDLCVMLPAVCAASQLVLTLTRRTPDQLKSPHRGFFEIQPWWWVILAPALSGSPVKVIMFPESRRREGWLRHHFDGSSAQNLPNCSPPNESGLLNLKAIMFPEWGREGKGPSPHDRSAAFEHWVPTSSSSLAFSSPSSSIALSSWSDARSNWEFVKRIFVKDALYFLLIFVKPFEWWASKAIGDWKGPDVGYLSAGARVFLSESRQTDVAKHSK